MPALAILLKRVASNAQLLAVSVLGLGLLCALMIAIPLYAEAVSTQALRHELAAANGERTMPNAAILLSYRPTRNVAPLTAERYAAVDQFARDEVAAQTGLPAILASHYAQTDELPFFAKATASTAPPDGQVFFATLGNVVEHVDILEGWMPKVGAAEWEALIATAGLDEFGLRIGDRIEVAMTTGSGASRVPVRIVGRWEPKDPEEVYWFNRADYYQHALLLPEETYFGELAKRAPRATREYDWYLLFDPGALRIGDVDRIVDGFTALRAASDQVLSGLKVDLSPEDLLAAFSQRSYFLQVLLFVLSAPLLVIALQFIGSAAGMIVERERAEIAVLKSRGARTGQLALMYLAQWSLLALPSLALALPLAVAIAVLIGRTSGFLSFDLAVRLPVILQPASVVYGLAATALAIVAAMAPALAAARHSIVTYKQQAARVAPLGFWRRHWLDLLPVPAAGYVYYLLSERQSVLPVGQAGDAFSDPLLLLAPALALVAGATLFLRLFPLLVALVARLVAPFAGVAAPMALRQISRQPSQYHSLVLLLTLTVALGAFSAAAAATIERNYGDQAAYRVGADLRLSETAAYSEDAQEWTLLPLSDHLQAPGVVAAARVLGVKASEKVSVRGGELNLLGVDSAELQSIMHWRADYAEQSLAELADALAADPSATLADRRLLQAYGLGVGDHLTAVVKNSEIDLTIAGTLDYFPTVYPEDGRFLVVNVDYLFDQLGPQPHEVWLRLQDKGEPASVVDFLLGQGLPIVRWESLGGALDEQRRDATRLGVLGLLSVGFLIAALLTVLALLLHAYLSFRRRAQQLAILRAIGLTFGQLAMVFVSEQALLLVLGVGAGTALGRLVALLYLPFLQIKAARHAGVPPYLVVARWEHLGPLLGVLGAFLLLAVPIAIWLLHRVRIHQALRFGEEQG